MRRKTRSLLKRRAECLQGHYVRANVLWEHGSQQQPHDDACAPASVQPFVPYFASNLVDLR